MGNSSNFFDKSILNKEVKFQSAESLGYTKERSSHKNIQSIFYDGEDYKGKKTKVFAYLGIPEHKEGSKLPAVVLVHGGGGIAFDQWVNQWNEKGYVAIAMDLEGHIPTEAPKTEADAPREAHAFPGPTNDEYAVIEPKEEVWMYHAVHDVIYAHNILRGLDCVDNNKIGIIGVSWGGVTTATTIGIDKRFAFAVPVFGAGYIYLSRTKFNQKMTFEKKMWDASQFFMNSTVPTFWINGDRDEAFDFSITSKSATTIKGDSYISIKPAFDHSHEVVWYECPEIFEFAEYIVAGGTALISVDIVKIIDDKAYVSVKIPEGRELKEILMYSNNSNDVSYFDAEDKAFDVVSGKFDGTNYIFDIPSNSLRFYIYAKDGDGNVTTSFVCELNEYKGW